MTKDLEIKDLNVKLEGTDVDYYNNAAVYWEGVDSTINGMLGGFGKITDIDIDSSNKLLKLLFKVKHTMNKSHQWRYRIFLARKPAWTRQSFGLRSRDRPDFKASADQAFCPSRSCGAEPHLPRESQRVSQRHRTSWNTVLLWTAKLRTSRLSLWRDLVPMGSGTLDRWSLDWLFQKVFEGLETERICHCEREHHLQWRNRDGRWG